MADQTLAAVKTTDAGVVLGSSWDLDVTVVPGGSVGHSDWHGP